jgi:hypothetical protein
MNPVEGLKKAIIRFYGDRNEAVPDADRIIGEAKGEYSGVNIRIQVKDAFSKELRRRLRTLSIT